MLERILNAVTNALGSALGSGSSASSTAVQQSAATAEQTVTQAADTSEPETTAAAQAGEGTIALEDGTYSGSGTGFRGETVVSVTVSNGFITAIKVTSYKDDERFFTQAETTVINEILAGQTPDVDAVSGATYSSNGIMEAVANALGIDFTAATPAEGPRGGHGRH